MLDSKVRFLYSGVTQALSRNHLAHAVSSPGNHSALRKSCVLLKMNLKWQLPGSYSLNDKPTCLIMNGRTCQGVCAKPEKTICQIDQVVM
jgi:hypothetical protein